MKGQLRRSLACCFLSSAGLVAPGTAATAFGQTAYVPNTQSSLHPPSFKSRVSVVNTASGKVLRKIDVALGMSAIALTPDGSSVYVPSEGTNVVTVIDTARGTVKAVIPDVIEPVDIAISPDGSKAYAVSLDYGIFVIDTATNEVVKSIRFDCTGVTFSPDGTKAYAMGRQGHIFEIDTFADKVASGFSIPGLNVVGKPAFSSDGSRFYVPNIQAKVIQVVDTGTKTLLSPISVPKGLDSVAIAPRGTGYALNSNGTLLTAVDLVKGKATGTINVGPDAKSINFAHNGSTGFVTTRKGLVVIDTATNAVVKTINVGGTIIAGGSFIAPPLSPLVATVSPAARSVSVGAHPTLQAALTNNGQKLLKCSIKVLSPSGNDLQLSYRPTDLKGHPIGTANVQTGIPAHSTQTFDVALTSNTAFAVASMPLIFDCEGVTRAPTVVGLNTLDLAFSANKTADVIARAAGDTVTVPVNGSKSFAVATANQGAADTLTVSADDGDALLPVAITVCPSNPKTSACLLASAKSVSVPFAAGEKRTFSVFVHAADYIPLDPNRSRIFVRFKDKAGASRGLASVAVDTTSIDPKNPPIPGPVYSASFSGTGNPRTQFCDYGTSYSGSATVSLNPGSVTGKIKITGAGKVTLVSNTSGGSQFCLTGSSVSLNTTGDIDLLSGKVIWSTTAFGVFERSLTSVTGSFEGTITTTKITGTLTEEDPIVGRTTIPLTLPVKH
jgi:YVTN family beta-propeller protein